MDVTAELHSFTNFISQPATFSLWNQQSERKTLKTTREAFLRLQLFFFLSIFYQMFTCLESSNNAT